MDYKFWKSTLYVPDIEQQGPWLNFAHTVLANKGSLTRDFRLRGNIRNFVFIAGVVDTGIKLFSGVNDNGNKLSLVSLLPVIDTVD